MKSLVAPLRLAVILLSGLVLGGLVPGQTCTWSSPGGGVLRSGIVKAMAVFNDGSGPALYLGGYFTMAGGGPVNHIVRWDGTNWTSIGGGTNDYVNAFAIHDDGSGPALYAGGEFTVAGGLSTARIAKWDGSAWAPLGGGLTGGRVDDLKVFDDGSGAQLYAAGTFSSGIACWDGTSWSVPGTGLQAGSGSGSGQALAVYNDGAGLALYVGGSFTGAGGQPADNLAKWDGNTWSPVSGLTGSSYVFAMAVYDDGNGPGLYVTGGFTTAGGLPAARIARWDGSSWSPLGSGLDAAARYLGVHDDGSGSYLYAGGGNLKLAGGVAVRNLAKWDGSGWSSPGGGFNDTVYALKNFDHGTGPGLYAAGGFSMSAGVPAVGMAKWSGGAWTGVGSGILRDCPGQIQALLAIDDGAGPALYVGGQFTAAGGVLAQNVARWSGTAWTPLGVGVTGSSGQGTVVDLVVHDDGTGPALFAGGGFSWAGGLSVSNIARWNGLSWSSVGAGVSGGIESLLAFDDGSGRALYAGGNLSSAGGTPVNYVARWDGVAWSPVGSTLSSRVLDLADYDDGSGPALYAAVGLWGVWKWNGSVWSAVGSQFEAQNLAVFNDGTGPALFADNHSGYGMVSVGRWNGNSWTWMGNVTGSTPWAANILDLTVFDDGTGPALWVSGEFDQAGGAPAESVARWDGTSWSGLVPGITGISAASCSSVPWVNRMEVLHDGTEAALYLGGMIGTAGGVSVNSLARWTCGSSLSLSVTQTSAGASVYVRNTNLLPGHEYYNIFSLDLCSGGPGSGPIGGLCITTPANLQFITDQILAPLGAAPFHFAVLTSYVNWGGYPLPSLLSLDGICLDHTGGVIGPVSPVIRVIVQ